MALALNDRVQQTGTANTTVSFTLSGSVTGFQSFAVVGNTNTTYYSATDASGNWEVGIGTYSTTGPTLARTTILSSSNSGSAVTFSGTVNVFVTYPSSKAVNLDGSGNASALGTISSGTWNGSVIAPAYGGTGIANNAASTVTISGNFATTLTVSGTTTLTLPTTGTVTTNAGTVTLTNKRIDPRVSSSASASSLTPDISSFDAYAYTALAAALTINAPTGTPVDGDKLIFRLLDNGTSQTLTWNATYTIIGVTLPTATTISKTTYVGCIYNANNTRWDVIAVTTQA
jgi:hypothetical protein